MLQLNFRIRRSFFAVLAACLVTFSPGVQAQSLAGDIVEASTVKQLTYPNSYVLQDTVKITPRVYGKLLVSNFKQQALSPFHVQKKGWLQGAAFTAVVFGIGFFDDPIQNWAAKLHEHNDWLHDYSHTITNLGGTYEVATFAGLTAIGFLSKDEKLRTTTYLATQAYITSTFWAGLLKKLSGRERPGNSNFTPVSFSPGFHGPFYTLTNGNSAFPSGHATLAFAAATVYAKEYSHIKAVPIVAYSVASLISLSRITENRHWATDIVSGAALGFLCGKQVVNNYHRFARQHNKSSLAARLSPTLNYLNGIFTPGFVYSF